VTAIVPVLPPEIAASAGRGWRLFPVEARGKLPLLKGWPEAATSDIAQLEAWEAQFPGLNWGLATGTASGLTVIDVDGGEGRASLADLEGQGLTLPATLTVTTGRMDGGEHRYYRLPSGVDIRNDQSGKIGSHIDVRGTGGLVVCPPSIHASGKQYRFIDSSVPVADLPDWVIERLTVRPPMPTATAQASPQAVGKGSRTNMLVSLAGTMQKRGMSVEAIEAALLAENMAKCSPPLPETKVRSIATDIPKRYPAREFTPPESGFRFVGIGELLSRPEAPPDYLVSGLLVRGTGSVAVAKPKVGKSTFARGLCLAVAHGAEFFGRGTRQGACIYLALEERQEELTADFRAMGATEADPITVHADAAPESAILHLVDLVRKQRPALVVIDPLFRLARIRDEKAYAEVYAALGPLIDLARETDTHILLTHHSGKSLKGDAIDSPLGSTALGGAVSTVIVLKRTESYRSLQTVQRIGFDMPETILSFDSETRLLSVGGTRVEADCLEVEKEIAEYLKAGGEKLEPEIVDHVEGRTTVKRKALRCLVEKGAVDRVGTGKRNDPYKYSFSCSQHIAGTREQETETGPQTCMDIGRILVPENSQSQMLVSEMKAVGKDDRCRPNPNDRPGAQTAKQR
jgi:hypothetical protein